MPAVTSVLAMLLSGCGAQYRPVVSAINPVGPAGQPTKYAVAISSPSPTLPGLATFVDVSGDTVLSTPSILANPSYFAINSSGSEGYTINASGSLNSFGLSNPSGLLTSDVLQTTLPVNASPLTITTIAPAGASQTVFVPEPGTSRVAALGNNGNTLLSEVAVGANPVYVVGSDGTPRVYVISQGSGGGNGQIAALEAISTSSYSVSTTIPVGAKPVYGVMTADTRRAFILNQGSGTVSVVNVANNALDTTLPTITIPQIALAGGGTTAPNPVWADFSPTTTELVVLNQGDGVHPGTLSIINIPLCTNSSQTTNPNCNAANPVDAVGFGQIVSTVTVGINPTMVSVLRDGSRAYVVNSGNATTDGSLSVVNLTAGTVTATIPAVSAATATANPTSTPAAVYGHPNTVAATTGTPTGKVYITSPDNKYLTVLYTDTDTVQAHITMQGLGVRVLVTSP